MLLITTIGLLNVSPKTVSETVGDINAAKSAPTGDHSISYPLISIRINRTPELADDADAKLPIEDQEERAEAVFNELTSFLEVDSWAMLGLLYLTASNLGIILLMVSIIGMVL